MISFSHLSEALYLNQSITGLTQTNNYFISSRTKHGNGMTYAALSATSRIGCHVAMEIKSTQMVTTLFCLVFNQSINNFCLLRSFFLILITGVGSGEGLEPTGQSRLCLPVGVCYTKLKLKTASCEEKWKLKLVTGNFTGNRLTDDHITTFCMLSFSKFKCLRLT